MVDYVGDEELAPGRYTLLVMEDGGATSRAPELTNVLTTLLTRD